MTFYQSEIFEFFKIFFRKSEFKVDLVIREFYKIALGHQKNPKWSIFGEYGVTDW